jgi:hypothetical protein
MEGHHDALRLLTIAGNGVGVLIGRLGANNATTDGVLVRRNVIEDNLGSGLFALDSYNIDVQRNLARGNGGDGLILWGEVFRSG